MKEEFSTPYSRAWEAFSMTNEFVTAVRLSTQVGEDSKYAINRLRNAFDAGWKAGLMVDEPQLCAKCGAIHAPGGNTLCDQ